MARLKEPRRAMNTTIHPTPLPSQQEAELARTSSRNLSVVLSSRAETQQFDFKDDRGQTRTVELPTSVVRLMVDVLTEMGQGNAVSIIPIHAELTTQEAADLLNVSRPYFVQLLEKKEIPFRKVNTHRRVRYEDVMAYKNRIDAQRRKALDELAALSQDMGLE
jgi:excisionase family DNA binding protein